MDAIKVAQDLYAKYGHSFEAALSRCLVKGTVISIQNRVLVLIEAGRWDGENFDDEVYDPREFNCWHVLFAYAPGLTTDQLINLAPFYLPYVAFARRFGKLRVYSTERVRRVIK